MYLLLEISSFLDILVNHASMVRRRHVNEISKITKIAQILQISKILENPPDSGISDLGGFRGFLTLADVAGFLT